MINKLSIINDNEFEENKQSKYGYNPNSRSITDHIQYGFINLDKPAGPTSHEVVSIVKKILGISKAGHSGTLDPQVTGVLPIGLLSSTKVLSTLLLSKKVYICNMASNKPIHNEILLDIFNEFTGNIYQVPPLKSNVVKKLRTRQIYDIQLVDQVDNNSLFLVKSAAGTYIRTLCIDIGRAIGYNSYMKELRRVQTGPFDETTITTLHQLFDAWEEFKETHNEQKLRNIIAPVENAVKHLPEIIINDNAVNAVCHGIDLKIPGIIAHSEFFSNQTVAIKTAKMELIGIAITNMNSSEINDKNKGIVCHPSKIIMKRDLYPRIMT